jgi:hypothetical protein
VPTDGAVLGRNLYLLRPNEAAVDPWFLAGHLRTSGNERQASSLSGVNRFDVRRVRVPRMSLAEQRRYAEVFRRLHTFDAAMRQAADLAADLVQMAADGLARGIVQPDGLSASTAKRQRRRT